MRLPNWKPWRRPINPDAVDAIHGAEMAKHRALERTDQMQQINDRLERRIEQNHFGEALVLAWAGRGT